MNFNLEESRKKMLEKKYPVGTRVRIISLCNFEPNYPEGLEGTVEFIDSACQIHVHWDNNGGIALLPFEGDRFEIIK